MLAGKPLIVTDAPGVRDYVVPGQTALVVENDPEALRAAITWVLDPANKAEVQLMTERARRTVEEQYLARHYFARLWETATQEAATQEAATQEAATQEAATQEAASRARAGDGAAGPAPGNI
jgi:hypothetical protein